MKTRDIVVGLIILAVFITGILVFNRSKKTTSPKVTSPTPSYQQVENKFPSLKIPSNADRVGLTDVSGGQGIGEAWRTFQNGKFSITVVADLPAYKPGHFYQGWISDGVSFVSLGGLGVTKGGYLVDFTSSKDYSTFKKVIVTSETVFDSKPEIHILEGSF